MTMRLYALGTIDPLAVTSFAGFDVAAPATLVPVLSDGVSVANAVLQSGAAGWGQAKVSGDLQDADDVATLRGYYASKEEVTFIDAYGNSSTVRVLELEIADVAVDWWSFSATLICEAPVWA